MFLWSLDIRYGKFPVYGRHWMNTEEGLAWPLSQVVQPYQHYTGNHPPAGTWRASISSLPNTHRWITKTPIQVPSPVTWTIAIAFWPTGVLDPPWDTLSFGIHCLHESQNGPIETQVGSGHSGSNKTQWQSKSFICSGPSPIQPLSPWALLSSIHLSTHPGQLPWAPHGSQQDKLRSWCPLFRMFFLWFSTRFVLPSHLCSVQIRAHFTNRSI